MIPLLLVLLAQMQDGVRLILPSEEKMLSGAVKTCSAELDPMLGIYSLTLWMPADEQEWRWTFTEEPFLGRTVMNGCRTGCKQKWTITRFGPIDDANHVPDAWSVAFTCKRCYHAFFTQGGQSRDLCYPQEAKK
jgi:hypothetical protein